MSIKEKWTKKWQNAIGRKKDTFGTLCHYVGDGSLVTAEEAYDKIVGDDGLDLSCMVGSSPTFYDIKPLSIFYHLTEIRLGNHKISNLSPLQTLANLKNLYLFDNEIEDLSPLSGLQRLEQLHLGQNKISNLLPISNLSNLRVLDLSKNEINDLQPIAGIVLLQSLDICGNCVSDINPISQLTNLTRLWMSMNLIKHLKPISGLVHLRELHIRQNRITDLSPITNLSNLTMLGLAINQVKSLEPIMGLFKLKKLWIEDNCISDVYPVTNLTKLEIVGLGRNQIVDFAPLAHVEKVYGKDDQEVSTPAHLQQSGVSSDFCDWSECGHNCNKRENASPDGNQDCSTPSRLDLYDGNYASASGRDQTDVVKIMKCRFHLVAKK